MRTIETEADRLVDIVDMKGSVTAREAAKILGLRERTVEEWADFLEQKGIINVKMNLLNLRLISKEAKRI